MKYLFSLILAGALAYGALTALDRCRVVAAPQGVVIVACRAGRLP